MLSSISGQTERWAQLAASPGSPAAQVSRANWLSAAEPTAAITTPGTVTGVSGSTGLTNGTTLALLALAGNPVQPVAAPSQGAAPLVQSSTGTGTDDDAISNSGSSAVAQLLNDLQSLVNVLGGGGNAPVENSTASVSDAASASSATAIVNTGSIGPSGAIAQDLSQVASDLGSLISLLEPTSAASTDPETVAPPRPPVQPAANDIETGGTASASADILTASTAAADVSGSDGLRAFMQQFALAAYHSGYASGMESASTTSKSSVSA